MDYNLSDYDTLVILVVLKDKTNNEIHNGIFTIPDFEEDKLPEIYSNYFSNYYILSSIVNPISSIIPSAHVNYGHVSISDTTTEIISQN